MLTEKGSNKVNGPLFANGNIREKIRVFVNLFECPAYFIFVQLSYWTLP